MTLFRRAEEECQAFLCYVGLPAFDAFRDDALRCNVAGLGLPAALA